MSRLRAFTMPKWGIEMLEGRISEWTVKEGERFKRGQTLAQIESDKIVNEVQAEYDATCVSRIAIPGEAYPVGALLGVMADEPVPTADVAAFIAAFRPAGAAGEALENASRSDGVETLGVGAVIRSIPAGIPISPAARDLAERLQIDVLKISGSGPNGRITLQDVTQAAKPPRLIGAANPVTIEPTTDNALNSYSVEVLRMSPIRKAIARKLMLSKSTIPHYYLRAKLNLDALLTLRNSVKQREGMSPSLNVYLVRAAALALMDTPDMNIQVHGDEIHRHRHADIAVAVATDRGLLTPVLRAAESKPLAVLAHELGTLLKRARVGKLRAEELEGGSFTVSNLGMFGVEQFDAIINAPQGAILAIGVTQRCAVERSDGPGFSSLASVSLSCDHRAIDGAVGARFLASLRSLVAAPEQL